MSTDIGAKGLGAVVGSTNGNVPSSTPIAATRSDSWIPTACVIPPPTEKPVTYIRLGSGFKPAFITAISCRRNPMSSGTEAPRLVHNQLDPPSAPPSNCHIPVLPGGSVALGRTRAKPAAFAFPIIVGSSSIGYPGPDPWDPCKPKTTPLVVAT